MPKRKMKKSAEEYAFLGIRVTGYSARINVAINHDVRDPRHYDDNAKVYEFGASLDIEGTYTYPDERAG